MKNQIINRPHPGLFWRVILKLLRDAERDIGPERARAVIRERFQIMRREYRATPQPWVPFPINAD